MRGHDLTNKKSMKKTNTLRFQSTGGWHPSWLGHPSETQARMALDFFLPTPQICDGWGWEEGQNVDRHGDGGGHLHQPHVHGPRLWPSLLCEKRLVRPSLQKLHGGFKLSLNILTFWFVPGKSWMSPKTLLQGAFTILYFYNSIHLQTFSEERQRNSQLQNVSFSLKLVTSDWPLEIDSQGTLKAWKVFLGHLMFSLCGWAWNS